MPVITDYRVAPYETSEVELFRQMITDLPKGCIWVADRCLSNYVNFVLSEAYGLDWIARLHQRRDGKDLAKKGKRIGNDEWLVTLHLSDPIRRAYPDLDLPKTITARLVCHRYQDKGMKRSMWILTSLLDPVAYPREEIITAYRSRWGIETHYAYLKTTLDMAILRSKTERNIRSEIGAIMLAHNLVWMLICEAAKGIGISPRRISFACAVKTILAYSPRICAAVCPRRLHLYRQMLQRLALHQNRDRPGRKEPRMVKRGKKRFPALKTSRKEALDAA